MTLKFHLLNIHQGRESSFFEISLYYYVPATLWAMAAPQIFRFTVFSFKNWGLTKSMIVQLSVALIAAPLFRLASLLADFSIKWVLGIISNSPLEIIGEVYLILWATTPDAFFTYSIIALISYGIILINRKNLPDGETSILVVNDRTAKAVIKLKDVIWMEPDGNYVMYHTDDGQFKKRQKISAVATVLPEKFQRIHRSAIINTTKIRTITHWRNGEYLISLSNGQHLTSSKTYYPNIKRIMSRLEANSVTSEHKLIPSI